jgi:acetyl esterase/lipase
LEGDVTDLTNVRIVVSGLTPGSVRLLEELLATWHTSRGVTSEIAVANGREQMLVQVARGMNEADGVVVTPSDWSDLHLVADALPRSPVLVGVGIDEADAGDCGASAAWGIPVIRGRGLDGFRWAVAWLQQRLAFPFEELAYGEHPDQIADLRLPATGDAPFPVGVFLHGGFWRERWVRDTIEPIAIDLARRGFATVNVEYRRVGGGFEGWRQTAGDVAEAIDRLAVRGDQLDLSRVVLVGHSAGAQLAAWAMKRRGVARTAPLVRPAGVVLLAGMVDLHETARRGLGDTGNPTVAFLGGDARERSSDYELASPHTNLPLGVAQIVVQGMRDSPDLVDMARAYADAAEEAGDQVVYLEFEDGDHFSVVTPSGREWHATVLAMQQLLADHSTSERP